MLNKNNERELAYVVKIDAIEPIEGSDNCEAAYVGGWHIMVRKNTFKVGDLAVYFEIDSHLDTNKPEFAFLEKRNGNIKTQRYTFGGKGKFLSQGLLMSFADFGWGPKDHKEGDFLTKELGVTYSAPEDNARKASGNKYSGMQTRHQKIFKSKIGRWIMKYKVGREIMFFIFGKKSDKKTEWPSWVVKTDAERAQNLPYLFPGDDTEWIATEKIDGTSTTFTIKGTGAQQQFIVGSRNVAFQIPKHKEQIKGNVYLEMESKYAMKEKMQKMFAEEKKNNPNLVFITIQGETYGTSIQKRTYGKKEPELAIFNIIFGYPNGATERLNPLAGSEYAAKWGLPFVPVLDAHFKIPATCEELLKMADGVSQIDGDIREGIVFRSYDGKRSFKAVSNEYLLKKG